MLIKKHAKKCVHSAQLQSRYVTKKCRDEMRRDSSSNIMNADRYNYYSNLHSGDVTCVTQRRAVDNTSRLTFCIILIITCA